MDLPLVGRTYRLLLVQAQREFTVTAVIDYAQKSNLSKHAWYVGYHHAGDPQKVGGFYLFADSPRATGIQAMELLDSP